MHITCYIFKYSLQNLIWILALSISLILSIVGMHYDTIYKEIAIALIGVAGGYIGGRRVTLSSYIK